MTETDAAFLAEITDQPTPPPDPEPPCRVLRGDVLEVLQGVESDRFHAVLCDPPYGLSEPLCGEEAAQVLAQWIAEGEYVRTKGRKKPAKPGGTDATSRLTGGGFMGAQWDSFVPGPRVWAEVLRVTRPGGYLLAFAGSRTAGWMEISLMLAGWEVLDTIVSMYAEGFPKGGNVGKRVDDLLGGKREVVGVKHYAGLGPEVYGSAGTSSRAFGVAETGKQGDFLTKRGETDPATGEGAIWDDWSTTLKPAHEPVIVARRPLSEKSVAANLLRWRTGAMNIGACRIPSEAALVRPAVLRHDNEVYGVGLGAGVQTEPAGRWPANLMLTHSEACGDECAQGCPVHALNTQAGPRVSGGGASRETFNGRAGGFWSPSTGRPAGPYQGNATTDASRFFFCAKASPSDRTEGAPAGVNKHPTVKPVPLIRELARLIAPQPVAGWVKDGDTWRWEDRPPGEVLVPFAGSGSEVVACALEGLRAVGIEREAEYHAIAEARVAHALQLITEGRCPKHWRRRGE